MGWAIEDVACEWAWPDLIGNLRSAQNLGCKNINVKWARLKIPAQTLSAAHYNPT